MFAQMFKAAIYNPNNLLVRAETLNKIHSSLLPGTVFWAVHQSCMSRGRP